MKPTLGDVVHYRGKQGHQALRAAIVTAIQDTLDPRGIQAREVPALDSDSHVHLHVLTPSERGFFVEFNVPLDEPGHCRPGTWQWPTRQPWPASTEQPTSGPARSTPATAGTSSVARTGR